MTIDWQNTIAIACVVAAVLYLARRIWQVIRSAQQSRCGPCGGCGGDQAGVKPFLSVESMTHPDDAATSEHAK